MVEIRKTDEYVNWFSRLPDNNAAFRINARIRRLVLGNPGDVKSVGCGVTEIRIDYGPGYRVYYTRREGAIVILLICGDKNTQDRDIRRAITLADEV